MPALDDNQDSAGRDDAAAGGRAVPAESQGEGEKDADLASKPTGRGFP